MRQIKFRAWDVTAQKMWVPAISQDGRAMIELPTGGFAPDHSGDPIMQFTGLTDKNDVEIYEGDWVKSDDYIGFVEWNSEEACFEIVDNINEICYGLCRGAGYEVIGNIHESNGLAGRQ